MDVVVVEVVDVVVGSIVVVDVEVDGSSVVDVEVLGSSVVVDVPGPGVVVGTGEVAA